MSPIKAVVDTSRESGVRHLPHDRTHQASPRSRGCTGHRCVRDKQQECMHVAYSEQRTTRARRADIDATPSHLYRGPECCDDAVFLGRDFLFPPRCHSTGAYFTLFVCGSLRSMAVRVLRTLSFEMKWLSFECQYPGNTVCIHMGFLSHHGGG
jgi:hypothetical protein